MADNTAGQTRVGSNDQVTGGFAAGKITYDSTTITETEYTRVECGFQPRYIYWLNLTDRITVEWQEGFTSAQCMKSVAAGDKTLDTTAAAVVVEKLNQTGTASPGEILSRRPGSCKRHHQATPGGISCP